MQSSFRSVLVVGGGLNALGSENPSRYAISVSASSGALMYASAKCRRVSSSTSANEVSSTSSRRWTRTLRLAAADFADRASVEALTPARGLRVPAIAVLDIMEDHTDFALGVIGNLASELLDAVDPEPAVAPTN